MRDDQTVLLNANDVGKMLGVSARTIWSWAAAGRIPQPRKISRLRRWSRAELLAWEAAGCPDVEKWAALQAAGTKGGRQ